VHPVNCGAAILLLVLYTGDTGEMLQPSKISGTPVSAKDVSYPRAEGDDQGSGVKRDGSRWDATPQAFNPLSAVEGGLNESQLLDQYRKLRAARYDSSGG
jgi:hypothetical protein